MGGGYRFHRLEWRASVSDSKSGAEFCGSPKENRIGLSLDLGDMPANISLRRAKVYSPNGAVSGFNIDFSEQKIKLYIKELLDQDKYLQFILDHFRFCEAKDRSLMTRDSVFHFDDVGNFMTEDEVRSYLSLPIEVKMKLREEQADKDTME